MDQSAIPPRGTVRMPFFRCIELAVLLNSFLDLPLESFLRMAVIPFECCVLIDFGGILSVSTIETRSYCTFSTGLASVESSGGGLAEGEASDGTFGLERYSSQAAGSFQCLARSRAGRSAKAEFISDT